MLKRIKHDLYQRAFNSIDVPDDLSSIADIDKEGEVSVYKAGMTEEGLAGIVTAFEDLFRSGIYPGMSICLRKNGHMLLNRSLGWSRTADDTAVGSEPTLMSVNTPVCLFSASKAMTAMLIHRLAEQGHINLLDPVSHYIPAFGAKGKDRISIYQLLAHRGGVPIIETDVPAEMLQNLDEAVKLICEAEPICEKGRIPAYHAITSGFLFAKIIEETIGKSINDYMDESIRKPLGMRFFNYGLQEEDYGLAAHNYITGLPVGQRLGGALEKMFSVGLEDAIALSNQEEFYGSALPSANLFATAEEVSRFYQLMLNKGQWQGKQVLDPLSVFRATQEVAGPSFDKTLLLPMRYSAGFMLGGDPFGIWGGQSGNAFGHLGFANIFCWADPDRDISVALLSTGKPIIGPHIMALPKFISAVTKSCEVKSESVEAVA